MSESLLSKNALLARVPLPYLWRGGVDQRRRYRRSHVRADRARGRRAGVGLNGDPW